MLDAYAPFIITGIAVGSIYAIAAMGLVLTYKTSGIFNFGHGAVGAAAAFVFYDLYVIHHWPWGVAAVVAIVGFGGVVGLGLELLGRRLAAVTPAMKIVGTLGILLTTQGLTVVTFGNAQLNLPQYLPTNTFKVAGFHVGDNQVIVTLIAIASAIGLAMFFRRTTTGTAMRAVVDDPDLLDLTGVSPVRVQRIAWVLGSMFAALAGVLIAPLLELDAIFLTLLVVQTFGAAAIGRFVSLPLTYVGAIGLAVLQQLTEKWIGSSTSLQQLPLEVPFLMLFAVLLFTPRGWLPDYGRVVRAIVRDRRPARVPALVKAGITIAVVIAIPPVFGTKTILFATGAVYVGMFLSLAMLTRLSGLVSLCQIGLMAVGAAVFGHLSSQLPWLVALLVSGLIAVPFGAIVAIPAIRLSGIYLALATLGYGVLLEQVVYPQSWMFGGSAGVQASRPILFGLSFTSDRRYFYLSATIAGLMALSVVGIERSRLGRLLRALGDSPRALSTHGTDINVTRVIVFCVAAFFAGISGALYVPLFGTVNGDAFPSFLSLIVLAVFAVAGPGSVRPAVIAAGIYFVVPNYINSSHLINALPAVFGVAAIIAATASTRSGPTEWFASLSASSAWRRNSSPVLARVPGSV